MSLRRRARDTFQSRFMPTIRVVRKLTHKPLLVSETAVGPAAGQIRGIRNLFAGVRRHQLNGLVWFDMHQNGGINHQDWRLEDNPAALAAFRREARSFGPPLPR
jgi:mannan endo-1,4-beta-mannosidase